jgi:hypothetical protein
MIVYVYLFDVNEDILRLCRTHRRAAQDRFHARRVRALHLRRYHALAPQQARLVLLVRLNLLSHVLRLI